MNPVLTLAHNNIQLTERALESVAEQDIPAVEVFVVDNDSTDATLERLRDRRVPHARFTPQIGVSAGWNYGLKEFFAAGAEHVLVINNDVRLPRSFYRNLLWYMAEGCHFITGNSSDDLACLEAKPVIAQPVVPHPDFSAFLITRYAWETIGPFDENMMLYSSDQDYHLRGWRLGVSMMKADVPYYHERSSTLSRASADERRVIELQADADRAELTRKWGVSPGGPDYMAQFSEANWGIDSADNIKAVS